MGENEQVLILQFGKVVGDPINIPGDYFRIPLLQGIKRYEIKMHNIIGSKNDHKYQVDWEIYDPIIFYITGKSENDILVIINKHLNVFNGSTFSSILDSLSTMTVGDMVKVLSWYDNEFGYSSRMIDLAIHMAGS